MKIRLAADLQRDSIVDGPGIRTVLWTQGCPHHCKGCHNQQTWALDGGLLVDVEDVKLSLNELQGQDGITLSGGDPVFQPEACTEIAKHAKSIGLSVWCYTGYLFEKMLTNPKQRALLDYVDVLVDGPFILEEKSLDLYFKGSRNQRIIDVKQSLIKNEVILVEKYAKDKSIYTRPRREEHIYI